MSTRIDLLTPVGRLVQGDLYDPQTTDAEGKPLTIRTGANAGQPRVNYYFAIAIPKGAEQHWSQTEWGAKIYSAGVEGFPNGAYNSKTFAWKIIDGDSREPNRKGRVPAKMEGYAGHWVLNFSTSLAPSIYNADGTQQLIEKDHVNLGDYIQVFGSVTGNESSQQPGVFLNHKYVAFAGFGTRIITGPDPKAVGFGQSPLPAGVSAMPPAQGFNPAPVALPSLTAPVTPVPVNPVPVTPHTGILMPPVPPQAPVHVMLPAANGATYEQMIAAGWDDALLIQHGMMQG